MKVLALDTATEALSAAVLADGVVTERFEVIGRGHAERVLPLAAEVLGAAGLSLGDLDLLAVGRGPGAFTGVRIAISVVQGLALGSGLPVVGISDLEAVAAEALAGVDAGRVLVCLDARMGEVYWGFAERDATGARLLVEGLARPEAVPDWTPGAAVVGAGHGFSAYPALLERFGSRLLSVRPEILPRAGAIARLAVREALAGRAGRATDLEPVYLRNDVATPSTRTPGK